MPQARATHWRCHICNSFHMWHTTPACIFCDHHRCSTCVPLRKNASSTREHNPGVLQETRTEQPYWKCHRCLTQCPQGDGEERETWKCRLCRHLVCLECSASFKNAILGMSLVSFRAALGLNLTTIQPSVGILGDIQETPLWSSRSKIFQQRPTYQTRTLAPATAGGLFATDDEASALDLRASQKRSVQDTPLEVALGESKFKPDVRTRAPNSLQFKYDEVLAKFPSDSMPKSMAEPAFTFSTGSMRPETGQEANNPSFKRDTEFTVMPHSIGPRTSSLERPQDTVFEVASSALVEKLAQLSLTSFDETQVHQESLPIDDRTKKTSSDDELDTPCETDGEGDFAGAYSDDGSHVEPPELVDPISICDIVNQLVSAYLESISSRHAGRRQYATSSGNGTALRELTDGEPAANSTRSNQRNSKTKRGRANERDNSADKVLPHKRRKNDDHREGRKIFACQYCKFDKRRYSEHNVNEIHYRHCSSTYSVNIHRLRWHLYRVHSRPELYCSRCFRAFKSRELLDEHSRTTVPCQIRQCPFQEKMTHDQMAAIKERATTRDQVAIWYSIYKILFPGSSSPNSPYVEDISPEGVEDFEQWFIRQDLVLRDLFATRVASYLPRLPKEDCNILDTVLEGCLFELARRRGRDFHLPLTEAGPSTWIGAELEIQGTIALGVAEELEMLDPHVVLVKPRTDVDGIAESRSDIQQEFIADDGVQEFSEVSGPIQTPQAVPNGMQHSQWAELTAEDWEVVSSSLRLDDNFGECWEALGNDANFTTFLQQYQSDQEPPEIVPEDTGCARTQKGKGRAQNRDECLEESN